jgi:hypothetical protein
MRLEELKEAAPDLATMGHPERIRLFRWWLHVHKGRAHFQAADIGKCYDDLSGAKTIRRYGAKGSRAGRVLEVPSTRIIGNGSLPRFC